MLKLIAIVGTNSKRSTNRQLLQYMQKHFADKAEIELVEIKTILSSTNQLTSKYLLKYWKLLLKSKRQMALLSVLLSMITLFQLF